MWLVKGASDFIQRLSGLPPAPNVTLLDRRKPKPFSRPHTTPPLHTRLTSDGVASTYRMHPCQWTESLRMVWLLGRGGGWAWLRNAVSGGGPSSRAEPGTGKQGLDLTKCCTA